MIRTLLAASALVLAACTPPPEPVASPPVGPRPVVADGSPRSARDFARVAARVEPVAEAFCRERGGGSGGACDFVIVLERDPRMPPNAFQTVGPDGRPVIVVGASLLGQMRSDDEIAFVLAHEASHHVAGHLPRRQQNQVLGALILGGIVAATGGTDTPAAQQAVRDAMDVGAFVGGRSYAQSYEFEADRLGVFITDRAGYDPVRGARIFGRPALASGGGPVILSTHPASPERLARIAAVDAEIRSQRTAGLVPRP